MVGAIAALIIAMIALNPIVKIMGADTSAIINYTKSYSLTMFIGGFAIVMNFALEQVVRAEGASKESMFGMVVSTIFSLIFDPLFIIVLNNFFGLHGVIWSMTITEIITFLTGAILYIIFNNKIKKNQVVAN